jgi:hypothetical protein
MNPAPGNNKIFARSVLTVSGQDIFNLVLPQVVFAHECRGDKSRSDSQVLESILPRLL